MVRPVLSLALDPAVFEPCGNLFQREDGTEHGAASRLLAQVEILGTLHHLELIEVEMVGGEQRAVIDDLESSLDAAYEICGAGMLATVSYKNRSYVVLVTPFEA